MRQGICRDCRAADSIGIDSDDAEVSPPREAALSYGFIYQETIRDVLGFLPEKLTRDLDTSNMRKLPGDCLRPDEVKSHEPVAALSSPRTAIDRTRRYR